MKKNVSNIDKLGSRKLPGNFGILRDANANARILGPCGDTMEFWLQIEDDVIRGAMYITDGCHSSVICGALAAWMAEDISIAEARQLAPEEVYKAADEMVEKHCAVLAVNTLRAALDNYKEQQQ